MTMFSGFAGPDTAVSGDILVGLRSSANTRFHAESFLFKANNLDDVANAVTSFGNISPLTTKGDIIFFDGTNNVRLGIGSANEILITSGSAEPEWVANPGLLIANNLDDLESVSTALENLGLNTDDDVTFNEVVGTVSMTSPSFISTGLNKSSVANALTAHSGGGQGSALGLTKAINRVTTVAAGADSVKLPASAAGESIVVINAAASNSMDCYPASGEVINALSANVALAIVANSTVIFFCAVNGTWNSIVTA